MAERTSDIRILANELVRRMNEDSRRIRLLEQKLDRMESRISLTEDSISDEISGIKSSLDKITQNFKNTTLKLIENESKLIRFGKDLGKKATKMDFNQFEHYMDLMNPIVSSFITKEELERILEEKVGRKT